MTYSVNADGKPGMQLASIKSKLRKTKWLRLSLPKDIVQKAVDSDSKTLQIYIKCKGCDKRTRLILAQKGRRRRNLVTGSEQSKRRLHKRRPILYIHSQIQAENRSRRSVSNPKCASIPKGCSCRKMHLTVELDSVDGFSIISPKRYKTAICSTVCSDYSTHAQNFMTSLFDNSVTVGSGGWTRNSESLNICAPVSFRTLKLHYFDRDGEVQRATLPNMIVTECGCKT